MPRIVFAPLILAFSLTASAQLRMRDLWISIPERLAPVLTTNNRLDMIDFAESDMEAKVRNRLEGQSVLDTLTANYLRCTLTSHTDLQARFFPDSANDSTGVVALVNTSRTPSGVSTVLLYNTDWSPTGTSVSMPPIEAFADSCPAQALRELADLPLITMRLSPDAPTLTFTISPASLSRDQRKAVEGRLHPITYYWNERKRTFTPTTL